MFNQVEEYITRSVQTFLVDPPDTDYQRGFLAALLVLAEEALELRLDSPPFAEDPGRWCKQARHDFGSNAPMS